MSQHRVTIPFFVDDLEPSFDPTKHELVQVRVVPRSLRSYQKNPATAKFRFTEEEGERRATPINPWQLRDRFLSWPLEDWQHFFEISGKWDVGALSNVFSKGDFAEWQRLLKAALVCQARDWKTLKHTFNAQKAIFLRFPLPIIFEWDGEVPAVRIVGQNALTLMIATIQIDKLQGASFRECARHDCKNAPFRVEARQKIYCTQECAHLVAVRRSRERKKVKERARRKQRGKDGESHGTQKTR